jgi:3-methyladenine DNA glycosylase AlkC
MAVGAAADLDLDSRLSLIHAFADDQHFAVREWAWLSLRPHVASDIDAAISSLVAWTDAESPRIRRFAAEVTRPRGGVWSTHIPALKQQPARGLRILEPLKADESRYVQDSVANWLNDASRSSPDWVRATCARWLQLTSPETARICKRGMRGLLSSNRALELRDSNALDLRG